MPDSLPASVPRALGQLSARSPRIDVTLETGPALALIDAVRDGWIDAVVAVLPAPTRGLRVMSLGHQRVVAALPVMDTRALEQEVALERLAPERPGAPARRRPDFDGPLPDSVTGS